MGNISAVWLTPLQIIPEKVENLFGRKAQLLFCWDLLKILSYWRGKSRNILAVWFTPLQIIPEKVECLFGRKAQLVYVKDCLCEGCYNWPDFWFVQQICQHMFFLILLHIENITLACKTNMFFFQNNSFILMIFLWNLILLKMHV